MFFESPIQVRLTKEWENKLEELIKKYPNIFKNKTQIIRIGIQELWRLNENGELGKREQQAKDL